MDRLRPEAPGKCNCPGGRCPWVVEHQAGLGKVRSSEFCVYPGYSWFGTPGIEKGTSVCEFHGETEGSEADLGPETAPPTRRSFLARLGLLTAGALVVPGIGPWMGEAFAKTKKKAIMAANIQTPNQFGLLPYSMAMHIHSSFSEGPGSMHAQVSEASAYGITAMWFTDHDWRMSAIGYRQAVHFDALTETETDNSPWVWRPQQSGVLADHDGRIVSSPVSPLDPSTTPGALYVRAASVSGEAAYQFYADHTRSRENLRANLAGQQLSIEVFPMQAGPGAFLELVLSLSYRPAIGGRPAGQYQLAYRFSPADAGYATQGLVGIVSVPVVLGDWNSVVLDPVADASALWPDIDARDNSSADLWLGARSVEGAAAEGCFDYLRFTRSLTTGDAPLQLQDELVAAYQAMYPQVLVNRGVEVSKYGAHLNWYGGDQHLYQYPDRGLKGAGPPNFQTVANDLAHSYGALASINHPFGTGAGKANAIDAQEGATAETASGLIASGAYHADILEVGYRRRGNATLENHLALWDVMSQNGLWLTGNGVSDDHSGTVGLWAKMTNHFLTYAWAASSAQVDLLAALAAGRVYCGELGTFFGALDLSVEGNPMGSVSVRPDLNQRSVTIVGINLPPNTVVELVQGPVNYAGSTTSAATVVQTFASTLFASGSLDYVVDTSTDSFVRLNVLTTTSGIRVAFSNPIYLLRAFPPTVVPDVRRAPDTAW